jgi:hypothetical protein
VRTERTEQRAFARTRRTSAPRVRPRLRSNANGTPPAQHRERLRREHEQAAGEQRDEREHVEVHAVRARQRAVDSRCCAA